MITITVNKRYGASGATAGRARISAPSIGRALEIAGEGAEVEFPIDPDAFFAPTHEEGIDYEAMSPEDLELAYEAGLPGAHEAYLGALRDDLGEQGFEDYALQNCLI